MHGGKLKAEADVPSNTGLGKSEESLEGIHKLMFMRFIRGMLQWRPEDRKIN